MSSQYCSRECQKEHWGTHKADCKNPYADDKWCPRWVVQGRSPDFITSQGGPAMFGTLKYLWGNMPALDIMKIDRNEGTAYNNDIGLCFAASGDIRNVILSVLGLPKGFRAHSDVFINDKVFDIVCRNFAMLLIALQCSSNEAADIILHIWYSARISIKASRAISTFVLPLAEAVVIKIKDKSPTTIFSKTWEFGTRSLRLSLLKKQWQALVPKLAALSAAVSPKTESNRRAVMLAPTRQDHVDRAILTQPERHRQCTMRFREMGVLLPFSGDARPYKIPNPTLFDSEGNWQLHDSSDPLNGWRLEEVSSGVQLGAPKSDVYGAFYYYLLSKLKGFCERLSNIDITFQLLQYDASDLPHYLKTLPEKQRFFDRIEVSNIVDRGYLGLERTLTTLAPWLKPADVNPHATLLTLFLNAVAECEEPSETIQIAKDRSSVVHKFLPPHPSMLSRHSPAFIKYMVAIEFFKNFGAIFQRYMDEIDFNSCGNVAGMEPREKQTIVEPWPLRLDPKVDNSEAQLKFEFLMASGHTGCERYIEWIRVASKSGRHIAA
ncbi:MAG: hypothetical protein M1827_006721 [Pycnora praestabilis]|nr:MAG: hypothetical protein M1827_006721 [Pycnora praestabilis]